MSVNEALLSPPNTADLVQTGAPKGKARFCMPTWRGFTHKAFQCGLYEAQDVLVESDDVDLIYLEPGAGFRTKQIWQRRLLYRDITRQLVFVNPGLRPVQLTQNYDAFVAVCQNYWDLLYINAIEGWKDRCKTSILLIDEIWASLIPQYKYWLHALKRFDHVFVGYAGSAAPVAEAIEHPCHWLPGAVDALRFTPYPMAPERTVDVYSIGRRWQRVHEALLQQAAMGKMFYIHDTFPGADMEPFDHRQHRNLLANIAKRSRCFIVAPGKMDARDETGGQVEVGYRYYEGSAAGAVMIGKAPDCESFRQLFDWPEAVIDLRTDGSDVVEVVSELASRPERLRGISRRNAREALLRHDWIYRWKEIFTIAGISESPGMAARERRLRELATIAGNSD